MAGIGSMIPVAPEKANYVADFEQFEKNGASRAPGWVRELRQKAFTRFAELNFPNFKDEEWKYTSVAPLLKVPFRYAADHSVPTISKDELKRLTFGQPNWNRLVFVNGRYCSDLSQLSALPIGVVCASLARLLEKSAAGLQPTFMMM